MLTILPKLFFRAEAVCLSSRHCRPSPTAVLVALLLCVFASAHAQRPYIGFVYPAGGQTGATFQVKLGGQGMGDIDRIIVSGKGVSARILDYNPVLGPQEITLLSEQLKALKQSKSNAPVAMMENPMMADDTMMMGGPAATSAGARGSLMARIEKRIAEYVNRPASAALASIVYAEVTIAPGAAPGERELRVTTARGISNPMAFHVGQLPEHCRKPMITASYQVLGKEELALRKRPTNEVEVAISLPCTVNGQVASGELNRYRFSAKKGQRLVLTALARQLIPYIADAVPGWFQPVLVLYDARGKELAYSDDYRFKPDPTILFEVPKDGEYTFVIYDAIYRGREDFVYRVSIGELPFVTSMFPLGCQAGKPVPVKIKGWNLSHSEIPALPKEAPPGRYALYTTNGVLSNPLPFDVSPLPAVREREQNHPLSQAQRIQIPSVIDGRIDFRDDWDIYQFQGRAGEMIAAEVYARRLDSPLDSVLKLTDATGKIIAVNDDHEDLASGMNTHHADSYLLAKLPTNGTFYIHIGDTSRKGGEEYAYRLRISAPQADYALRVVPSSVPIRGSNSAALTIHVLRNDGFTNSIRIGLKDPPKGFSAVPVTVSGTQTVTRLVVKADVVATQQVVSLVVTGMARLQTNEIAAAPAEDRMQAFLWRHLVPAQELTALIYDPAYVVPGKRIPPPRPAKPTNMITVSLAAPTNAGTNLLASADATRPKPKFSKQQVAGRLRQLKLLYEEGLLTEAFYDEKCTECEAAQ